MQYITKVYDENSGVKHIIQCTSENEEVLQSAKKEKYGDKKDEEYFISGRVKVFHDLTFTVLATTSYYHFAEVMAAIEKVRFVLEQIKTQT